MDRVELFNLLLRIIIIFSYLKPYSGVQIIWIRLEYLINKITWNHLTVCKQMIDIE